MEDVCWHDQTSTHCPTARNNWLVLGYVKTWDIPRCTWYIQVYIMYAQSKHKSKMCIQFFQIWREHDVVCMWAVCVNVQTLENHPEMQNIIVCIYIDMHCISRHALSQTCIYMYMHGISHSGRGSGFQMKSLAAVTPLALAGTRRPNADRHSPPPAGVSAKWVARSLTE